MILNKTMRKLLVMIVLLLPTAIIAQEGKDTAIVIPQTENVFRMAVELVKYGYSNNDALSLIEAARLSKREGFTEEVRKHEGSDKQPPTSKEGKQGQITLDPAKLLADAKNMASDDDVLNMLIDDVNKMSVRGAVGGFKYSISWVDADAYVFYHVQFRGGEPAIVTIIGDGTTDLDLYIYDAKDNLVAKDTGSGDDCQCTFFPQWTSSYIIRIVNKGSSQNTYVFRTN